MKRWILIVLIAVALAAVVVIVGFTQIKLDALEEPGHLETVITTQAKHVLIARSSREGVPPAPTNLQASIEEGDKLFGTECAACHGLAHAGDWSRTLSTFEISPYYSGGVWEALAPDGSPATRESAGGTFASLAHGWASGPTSALSKYVLGVRPVQPGYKTWLIEPQPGDLSWAEGRVPTPYGPIAVRWQKTPRGLRLEINVR
jgi:Bacterial alpha-L-rhamnosidase C-terminal domain/Cytochrome c